MLSIFSRSFYPSVCLSWRNVSLERLSDTIKLFEETIERTVFDINRILLFLLFVFTIVFTNFCLYILNLTWCYEHIVFINLCIIMAEKAMLTPVILLENPMDGGA